MQVPSTSPVTSPYSSQLYDDFTDMLQNPGAVTTAVSRSWTAIPSGAGATCTALSGTGIPNRWGVQSLATGTTAVGTYRYVTQGSGCGQLASMLWAYTQVVVGVPVLSDATNTYQVFAGFGDISQSVNQGQLQANFLYDAQGVAIGGVASPNWQVWVREGASVTVVVLDGATHGGVATVASPVGIVNWITGASVCNLEVSLLPSTGVVFKINGVTVATVPLSAAAATANNALGQFVGIYKSAGVTSALLQLDYMRLSMERAGLPFP